MAATEGAKRKAVQDAIDRVLFKVGCNPGGLGREAGPAALGGDRNMLVWPAAPPVLQINELEAIVGEFDGNNDLLHAKL